MTLPLAPKPATLLRATCALLLLLALHTPAQAQGGCLNGGSGGCTSSVPEVDPSLATGAFTLLTCTVLLLRSRRSPR
jgi:hypothetical protein